MFSLTTAAQSLLTSRPTNPQILTQMGLDLYSHAAEGTQLVPKRALLHFKVLDPRPDGKNAQPGFLVQGLVVVEGSVSLAFVSARPVMSLMLLRFRDEL